MLNRITRLPRRTRRALRILHPGFGEILNTSANQAGPAVLMAGADTTAVVAVEVFVKQDQLPPARIVAIELLFAMTSTLTRGVWQEERRQAAVDLARDLKQVHH